MWYELLYCLAEFFLCGSQKILGWWITKCCFSKSSMRTKIVFWSTTTKLGWQVFCLSKCSHVYELQPTTCDLNAQANGNLQFLCSQSSNGYRRNTQIQYTDWVKSHLLVNKKLNWLQFITYLYVFYCNSKNNILWIYSK